MSFNGKTPPLSLTLRNIVNLSGQVFLFCIFPVWKRKAEVARKAEKPVIACGDSAFDLTTCVVQVSRRLNVDVAKLRDAAKNAPLGQRCWWLKVLASGFLLCETLFAE